MRTCLLAFLLTLSSTSVFSQSEPLGLTVKGFSVYDRDVKLLSSEVKSLMYSENAEALEMYTDGKRLEIVGYIVSFAGGFLFGYEIGNLLFNRGEYMDPLLIGVSLGVAGVGYVIGYIAGNKIDTAIELYNSTIRDKTACQLKFGLNNSGIGLSLKF